MNKFKPILVTAAIALAVMAFVFRAPANLRKLITG